MLCLKSFREAAPAERERERFDKNPSRSTDLAQGGAILANVPTDNEAVDACEQPACLCLPAGRADRCASGTTCLFVSQ